MKISKIYLGSDHAGYLLKEKIKKLLDYKKIKYVDLGTNSIKSVDYPDYAKKVSGEVVKDNNSRGILICGTGMGMVISANKIKGIRAAAPYDNYSAKMSRVDSNTNVLCLRGRFFPYDKIKNIISIWLKTPFSNKNRHLRRLKKGEIKC